jgi:hypothetical protein
MISGKTNGANITIGFMDYKHVVCDARFELITRISEMTGPT